MLIIDDLLTLPLSFLGFDLTPNLFMLIFDSLTNFARDKLIENINDHIKENRMLYEIGEREKADYDEINADLVERLSLIKKVESSEYESAIRELS